MRTATAPQDSLEHLWRDFCSGNTSARDQLLIYYLPLVKIAAGRMKSTLPGSVQYDDLTSAGLVGLINSLDNFNPSLGHKFETYAMPRIRGAILDSLRDVDWLPRSYRQKTRKLDSAIQRLTGTLGRSPSDEEIAAELGLEYDDYFDYIENIGAASLVSLDVKMSIGEDGDAGSFHDVIPDTDSKDPSVETEAEDIRRAAMDLLEELTEQERSVVALYYYEELTFREIGAVLGVSESRVSQIHTRLIATLRARLRQIMEK